MNKCLILLSLCVSLECAADVYKCTDAQGQTHYQSLPCAESRQAVEMNTKTGGSIDLTAQEKQKAAQTEAQKQQQLQQQAEEQAKLDAIAQRHRLAREESAITQAWIKAHPAQFSAFAIPAYDPEKLPSHVKPFEARLPDIEKFRRLAARKALDSGQCQRVESNEIGAKATLERLVFLINCSSGTSFTYTETELTP